MVTREGRASKLSATTPHISICTQMFGEVTTSSPQLSLDKSLVDKSKSCMWRIPQGFIRLNSAAIFSESSPPPPLFPAACATSSEMDGRRRRRAAIDPPFASPGPERRCCPFRRVAEAREVPATLFASLPPSQALQSPPCCPMEEGSSPPASSSSERGPDAFLPHRTTGDMLFSKLPTSTMLLLPPRRETSSSPCSKTQSSSASSAPSSRSCPRPTGASLRRSPARASGSSSAPPPRALASITA
mmetsp:Transcript_7208/g.17997  ORF Transcript_7208/g.17997 Transcript_7208/m.17997 type:complete len:244 (-) Transcript_7208:159-890(-)